MGRPLKKPTNVPGRKAARLKPEAEIERDAADAARWAKRHRVKELPSAAAKGAFQPEER